MNGSFGLSSGIGYPEDLSLLNRIFDRFCADYEIKIGGPEAEKIAQATMSLFQAGISNEAEIRASLEEFHRRRIG